MSPVAPPTRSAPARAAPAPLHTIPICRRPRPTLAQRLHLVLFNLSFLTLCLVLHAFQLLSVPFRPLQRLAKEAFGSVLVALVALFGPSTLVVTVQEGEECSLDEVVSKDPSGRVVGLRLDRHAVLVSNHQVRSARALLRRHPCRASAPGSTPTRWLTCCFELVLNREHRCTRVRRSRLSHPTFER